MEHGLGARRHRSASRVPAPHAWHAPGRKVQGQARSKPLQHLKPLAKGLEADGPWGPFQPKPVSKHLLLVGTQVARSGSLLKPGDPSHSISPAPPELPALLPPGVSPKSSPPRATQGCSPRSPPPPLQRPRSPPSASPPGWAPFPRPRLCPHLVAEDGPLHQPGVAVQAHPRVAAAPHGRPQPSSAPGRARQQEMAAAAGGARSHLPSAPGAGAAPRPRGAARLGSIPDRGNKKS